MNYSSVLVGGNLTRDPDLRERAKAMVPRARPDDEVDAMVAFRAEGVAEAYEHLIAYLETARTLASIVRRYSEGEPMRVLTSEYDVNASTVRNIVRRAGVPLRPVGRPRISAETTR